MPVQTRTLETVEADLAAATAASDTTRQRELEVERQRFTVGVERVYGPGEIGIRDSAQRSSAPPASERPRVLQPAPKVAGSAGIAVVVTAEADEAIRESLDDGVEVCGGLFGFTAGKEVVVTQATETRGQLRLRDAAEISVDQLQVEAEHFRAANWQLLGDWHSHLSAGNPASTPDREHWQAWADHTHRAWIGVIVEPRRTWFDSADWGRPAFRVFVATPGSSEIRVAGVVIETRSNS